MSTITKMFATTSDQGRLRPFDVRRDLAPVADLVEQCFATTLDAEGYQYLRQMRAAAQNNAYLRWASILTDRASLPLFGYVWEEDGHLVGNLTLIPFTTWGSRYYLIANVAVHPDYRRRGIARRLTQSAIEYTRQRGADSAWLHVRQENQAAGNLYHSLGFLERARRTTWHSQTESETDLLLHPQAAAQTQPESAIHFAPRRWRDWLAQRSWLKRDYPSELTWHLSLRLMALQPGLWGSLYRLFNDILVHHWTVRRGDHLEGVLSWQGTRGFSDQLWLAVRSVDDSRVVTALLQRARRQLSLRRLLSLDFPAGSAADAIRDAGFREHQTLIWMELPLGSSK